MVTDRFCTAGLLVVLSHLFASRHQYATITFLFLMFLDVVSHWCKMYRCVCPRGSSLSPGALS